MKPANSLSEHLPDINDPDRAIVNLSARIIAATYELLVLIRRFDERAGWSKWGLLNCADWLHWRCDLSTGRLAARPVSTTWCCFALVIIASCTRAAFLSRRTTLIAGCSNAPMATESPLADNAPMTRSMTMSISLNPQIACTTPWSRT